MSSSCCCGCSMCSLIPAIYLSWVPLIYYYASSFIFPQISALVALAAQILIILIDCTRKACTSIKAEFPKHLDVFLCLMYLVLLIISYVKANWIEQYNPIYLGLMLGLYSFLSLTIGRPFSSQFCQHLVLDREWRNKTFLAYTRCNTIVWLILFLICAASGAASVGNYQQIEKDHLKIFCKYILPPIAFALGLVFDYYIHSKVKASFINTDIFSHLDTDINGYSSPNSSKI